MRKIRPLGIVILTIAAALLFARPAYAYMDPGAATPFVAFLAPLFAMLRAALALMVRPFRVFFSSKIRKLLGRPQAEDMENDEQSVESDQGGNGVSEDNADDEAHS